MIAVLALLLVVNVTAFHVNDLRRLSTGYVPKTRYSFQMSPKVLSQPAGLPLFAIDSSSLDPLVTTLTSNFKSLLNNISPTLDATLNTIQDKFETNISPILTDSSTSGSIKSTLEYTSKITVPTLPQFYQYVEDQALYGHHLPVAPVVAAVVLTTVVYSVAFPIDYPEEGELNKIWSGTIYNKTLTHTHDIAFPAPYGYPEVYSPQKALEYYSKKPLLVARRCLQLAFSGAPLGLSLLIDKYITKKTEDLPTKKKRAQSLLKFVESNGCTYIKIGQAASVRSDIIDEVYASELSKLQDRVPPFSDSLARQSLETMFGPLSETFDMFNVDNGPIASASIGQVYKAKTKEGRDVAVKVQRPNVVNQIALDLFIVRR